MLLVAAMQSEAVATPVATIPAPASVHKSSIEQARWVTRCHRWRHHHHWHRSCHRVHI
jgi:hypothetical protein